MEQDCVNNTSEDRATKLAKAYAKAYDLILQKANKSPEKLGKIVSRSRQGARKWRWKGVPWEHIDALESELGVPGYEINPVVYPKDKILRWAEQIRKTQPST